MEEQLWLLDTILKDQAHLYLSCYTHTSITLKLHVLQPNKNKLQHFLASHVIFFPLSREWGQEAESLQQLL